MKTHDLAQRAYEAFAEHADRDKPRETHLPPWNELPLDIRVGWQVAILRTIDNLFAIAKHELLRDE